MTFRRSKRRTWWGGRAGRVGVCFGLPGMLLWVSAVGCRQKIAHPVETTERVYELHCVGCHGARGEGAWGSNIQDLKSSIPEITTVIADGVGKMPGYKGHLTDTQMKELAEYVKRFTRAKPASPSGG